MAKRRFTDDSWRKEPWFKALVAAFRSCGTDQDMENFLRDIGTLSELQAWSERFEVAKQLAQGKKYRDIAVNTGASTTTVTRVAKFLENGEGGYRKVLNAHRHHRMVSSSQEQQQTEMKSSGEVKKPISVLQKYLERATQDGVHGESKTEKQ
ncbi:MAG: YerC/YecD family TrpR-related protein [Candidatus Peribacteraceae bacterium]|nr:YerC/YecD family TrpR-related protein [Candidatus Peribacteraceae bacterium]